MILHLQRKYIDGNYKKDLLRTGTPTILTNLPYHTITYATSRLLVQYHAKQYNSNGNNKQQKDILPCSNQEMLL